MRRGGSLGPESWAHGGGVDAVRLLSDDAGFDCGGRVVDAADGIGCGGAEVDDGSDAIGGGGGGHVGKAVVVVNVAAAWWGIMLVKAMMKPIIVAMMTCVVKRGRL